MYSNITSLVSILTSQEFLKDFYSWSDLIAKYIVRCRDSNSLVTIFGNGGSAADAQHWAAELVCTYKSRSRSPFPVLALTTDTSTLTAWSNDFDVHCFQRQIQAFDQLNGLSLGLSTSGRSSNVLNGLEQARNLGSLTVLISGSSCDFLPSVDLHVRFPSTDTPIIQTLTQMLYHEVCQHLERQ